jgi:pimeloyl-ACP methyl ester carboxylesterase
MHQITTKTVMFISGAFVSHYYWEQWIWYFKSKGYKVVAPPWIHKNDTPENLRDENICNKIDSICLSELLCYYTEIIEQFQEKPILIGHSYGGLLVQLLVQQDLAAAGVCISSFPPAGLSLKKLVFYKNIIQFSNHFFSDKGIVLPTFKKWQNLLYNAASEEEQIIAFEDFIIPESKKVLCDLLLKNTRINFKKRHVPLFFIAGSKDNFVTSKVLYWNYKKYKNFYSITCYKKLEGKDHFLILDIQWKETAESIVKWLDKIS